MLWRLDGAGQFARALALEVAQELDGRSIANRWGLVPAGKRRKTKKRPPASALDLVVEAGEVSGWDEAAYAQVAPSTDVTPIITPWSAAPAVVYWFDADVALGPEPLPPERKRRR